MKELLNKAKYLVLFSLAISFFGCEDDDGTKLPEVISNFTFTLNEDTGTVTFINISEEAQTYVWDFGDETTSTEINPIKTYVNGTYTVKLTASNTAGASDSFESEVTVNVPGAVSFPATFDGQNINYEPETFNGASFEIIENPEASGSNEEVSNVGAITNSGAQFEGIAFDLTVDLSVDQTIVLDFWSDAPIDVLVKVEPSEPPVEISASHGGTGWEELSFTLPDTGSYTRLTIFVDGPGETAGTFYIDNISQVTLDVSTDCTEETEQSLSATDFNLTFQTDPADSILNDGAVITSIANPDTDNDVNNSCNVGQVSRGDQQFANNQIEFDSKFDFDANSGFKMKVWSPNVGTNVLVKLEDKTNSDTNVEVGAVTTVASAWEELTFDFASSESDKYDKIVLFFELGTFTVETYFIDDFRLYGDGGGGNNGQGSIDSPCVGSLLEDYETADNGIFSDFGGGTAVIIDNPNTTVNTSSKVGQMQKFAGEVFGGTTMSLDAPVDFTNGEIFTLDVFSQRASALTFKLEGLNIERVITTAGTGWETMTFDFTGETSGAAVPSITLIFDNGTAGDAAGDPDAWTFLFDNLRLCDNGSSGGGDCPAPPAGELLSNGGFEANSGDGACWQLNESAGSSVTVIDTDANTGTYSARLTTGPSQVPNLKQERFAPTVAGNQNIQVTFRYKITSSFVDGSILEVLAFSERSVGGAVPHNLGNAPGTNTVDVWQTYTGSFTTDAAVDEGLSLLIQATCGGAGTCAGEVIIDDVVVEQI